MKDTRRHYPKDPIVWGLLCNVWATGATICGKRRAIDWITDNPSLLTCDECVTTALAYWSEQAATCKSLIEYAETGQLKGTSAEKESEALLPKLRIALTQAQESVRVLSAPKGIKTNPRAYAYYCGFHDGSNGNTSNPPAEYGDDYRAGYTDATNDI